MHHFFAVLKNKSLVLLIIGMLSLVMHFRIFSLDLIGIHVWRQTQTQTTIRNFYTEDFHILNPKVNEKADTDRIFRMEFPVMQWVFAGFYKLLGTESITLSRILTFIIGLFSIAGIYSLLETLFRSRETAGAGAWAFSFSPVFYYYTVNPLPDNLALCMGIWSLSCFLRWSHQSRQRDLILSIIFLSIATLAKLPFIIYGGVVAGHFLSKFYKEKKTDFRSFFTTLGLYILLLLPAILWYAVVIPQWQNGVIKGIADSHESYTVLLDILWTNLISVLPELLLNYASVPFFVIAVYQLFSQKKYLHNDFPALAAGLLLVVAYFLYELNMIAKVHDYYLFPFLPFLFILVSSGIQSLLKHPASGARHFALFALFLLPFTAYLRINSRWNEQKPGFNPVYYTHKTELRKLIKPDELCVAGKDVSHYILLYYLDRKGWVFEEDTLRAAFLQEKIHQGAKYLFTDVVSENTPEMNLLLSEKIYENETLKVYRLKDKAISP